MYKRLFLLTLVFSLYMASLGFGQTPAGGSTLSISEPSISASTAEVVKYEICGMLSHQHTSTCQSSVYTHPVTSEWKPDSSVYIQIKTQASGYGLARAILSKVTIDSVDRIGGSAGNASAINSQYVGDCGVISTFWSTHAQAYTDTMTVHCRHYEPAGTVGSTYKWTADGSVEAYSVEWSRSGGGSVGLEVSGGVSGKDPNFTTTLTGSTHKGISSSYSGTATIAKPYPGAGASSEWQVSSDARCGSDLCTNYDDMTGSHDHHAICGGCGIHIKWKKRPGIHVLHATCPKPHCDALNVWECSHTCDSGSSSNTDNTPNCSDCTSHCSSPCSCANSGTCGGTVSYHACGEHEISESGSHSYGTYTCGSHSGYACQESNDHKTYISSCTSTNSDGNTCNNSSAYYECSQHSHTYPPSLVACGGASYTGCSGASSRTAHHVPSCSSGCGNGYWTCSSTAAYNHETTFTCRRPGCGSSFTRCTNSTCTSDWGTHAYHWASD